MPKMVLAKTLPLLTALTIVATTTSGCSESAPTSDSAPTTAAADDERAEADMDVYATFRLEADVSVLSDAEKAMVPLLIEAAEAMESVFWQQAYGDGAHEFLQGIDDPATRRFAVINYGPWNRLEGDAPFIEGVGEKPAGAGFYPPGVTKDEILEAPNAESLRGLYSMVLRGEDGGLEAVPYHQMFAESHREAAEKLRSAAALAEQDDLRRYLEARADALETDEYRASDLLWMDMRDNTLDIVIGPIENYEDQLLGAKAAHEAYVLIKDKSWSERLARYATLLPRLQKGLPVDDAYKRETPGTDADLGAYDVIFVAGHANAGSKAIAFNLPNDEQVQLEKGTRRVQMKNAMRAKFDSILEPIADVLIAEDQRAHVTFDAFFANTMFHEVAHGLGIKNVLDGSGTVREALENHASAIEEGKADVLGLYMVTRLADEGDLGDVDLMDFYTTFMASIFRSIRFGSSSAHGVANLLRFNYFQEKGAFARGEDGRYRVDPDAMRAAVDALSEAILVLQGDGDFAKVQAFVDRYGVETGALRSDLDRLSAAGIPVDIVFEQGLDVLGLEG